MAQDEPKQGKEFFDKIRRKVKEKEREKAHTIPLEQRRGITVFPPNPENLPLDPLAKLRGITVISAEN